MELDNFINLSSSDYNFTYLDPNEFDFNGAMNIPDIIVQSILLYIGLCTNIWMLWSLYKTWEAGSRSLFYLLVICIADVLGLCITCSLGIGTAVTYNWQGGNLGCKIFSPLQSFGAMFANLVLAGFSVDNVITVISSRSNRTVRKVFVVLALVLTVLYCVFLGFLYIQITSGPYVFCVLHLNGSVSSPLMIHLIFMGTTFWLPFFFIVFYGGPALCVWCGKKDAINYAKMNQGEETSSEMKTIGRDIGIATAYNILFVLCWMPLVVADLLFSSYLDMWSYKILYYITIANSCFNPIIYAIFNCINRRHGKVSPGL